MSSIKKSFSTKNVSKSKVLFVSTLLLTIASVILAASLVAIKNNNIIEANQASKIETFVPAATIEKILIAAEDNYVGSSEKVQLEIYLTDSNESSFSVKLVDNLVTSSYKKGSSFVSTLTPEEQSSEEIKEFNAYLWALTQPYSSEEIPELLENYIIQAKKVNMLLES